MTYELRIPETVRESVTGSLGAFFEKINHVDRTILGNDHVNPERYVKNIEMLNEIVPLRGKKLLEIGSGYGVSLALMQLSFGVDATGVEPASLGFDGSSAVLRKSFRPINLILRASWTPKAKDCRSPINASTLCIPITF